MDGERPCLSSIIQSLLIHCIRFFIEKESNFLAMDPDPRFLKSWIRIRIKIVWILSPVNLHENNIKMILFLLVFGCRHLNPWI